MSTCPSDEQLRRLQDGALDTAHRRDVESHVESCKDCQRVLDALNPGGVFGLLAGEDTDRQPQRPPAEGPGARIGPYKLLQLIGEGGFGSVYVAEQQSPVRRNVALKL